MHEVSEQFIRSVDGHRKELARVKGVTINAINQRVAGNAKDPYIEFRREFQEQAWAGCGVHEYIDDLVGIKQAAQRRSGHGLNLAQSLIEKLHCDARLGSAMVEAVADGMTREEAREVLAQLAAMERVHDRWRAAAVSVLGEDAPRKVAA
jgi:hypothetical protein